MEDRRFSELSDEVDVDLGEGGVGDGVPMWHDYTNISPWEEFVHGLEMAIKAMVFKVDNEVMLIIFIISFESCLW